MNTPYITVIICSYNGQRCIKRTLDGLYKQKDFDILVKEVILVDNNSTDLTTCIMKKAENTEKRAIYVRETIPGLSQARLCGFDNSTGDWIAYIDDDNYLASNWISNLDKNIKNSSKAGIIGGAIIPCINYDLTNENEIVLNHTYRSLAITNLNLTEIIPAEVHEVKSVYGAGMVVKREILEQLKKRGWLKLEGRTGNKLSAGEDSEICYTALSMGYTIFRFNNLLIEHDIPKNRLTIEYAKRLMAGIYEASFILKNREKNWPIKRLKMLAKILIHKIYKVKYVKNKSMENMLVKEINEAYDCVTWENLKSVKFILKSK